MSFEFPEWTGRSEMKAATKFTSWCPLIGTTIIGRMGYDWDLYGSFWWFDLTQHLMFFFALGLLMLRYSSNIAFVISLGLLLGVLWEILEWAYYTSWEAGDTWLDLYVDLLGLVTAIALSFVQASRDEASALYICLRPRSLVSFPRRRHAGSESPRRSQRVEKSLLGSSAVSNRPFSAPKQRVKGGFEAESRTRGRPRRVFNSLSSSRQPSK